MAVPLDPRALTRSKVGKRLRQAYDTIKAAQQQVGTKGSQTRMLHKVWLAIEQAEEQALTEVMSRLGHK